MVSLALAKQHLEYEGDDRDDLIAQYIAAARAWIESYTGKRLMVSTITETVDCLYDGRPLSAGPVVSLTSVDYIDTANAAQTLAGARVLSGRIYAPVGGWPSTADYTPATIVYEAGYADTPADLVSAQLLLIGHFFANREAVSERSATEVPFAVEALCAPYRGLSV